MGAPGWLPFLHQLPQCRPLWRPTSLPTQTDLASEAELAEVEAEIRRINAEAGITRCRRCQIDLSRILNTGLYSASSQPAAATAAFPVDAPASSGGGYKGGQQAAPSQEAAPAAGTGGAESVPAPQQASQQQPAGSSNEGAPCEDPQCSDPHHHHHHHQQEGSMHDARVGTVTIHLPGAPLDLPRLRRWLDTLLWEETAEAADLFRIKGLLHVAGSDRKHILQGGWYRCSCSRRGLAVGMCATGGARACHGQGTKPLAAAAACRVLGMCSAARSSARV